MAYERVSPGMYRNTATGGLERRQAPPMQPTQTPANVQTQALNTAYDQLGAGQSVPDLPQNVRPTNPPLGDQPVAQPAFQPMRPWGGTRTLGGWKGQYGMMDTVMNQMQQRKQGGY